jgi:hypothetical protein
MTFINENVFPNPEIVRILAITGCFCLFSLHCMYNLRTITKKDAMEHTTGKSQ